MLKRRDDSKLVRLIIWRGKLVRIVSAQKNRNYTTHVLYWSSKSRRVICIRLLWAVYVGNSETNTAMETEAIFSSVWKWFSEVTFSVRESCISRFRHRDISIYRQFLLSENLSIRNSRLFEGDMILSKDQQERAEEELNVDGSRHKRATLSIIKESSYQSINLLIDWSSYL